MVHSAHRLDCHDPGSCQYHGSWQDPGSMDPPAYNPGILGRRICQDPAGSWHFCYDFTLSWTHPWDDFDQTYIFRLVLTWATRVNKENIRVAIISNVFNGSWNPGSQKSAGPWLRARDSGTFLLPSNFIFQDRIVDRVKVSDRIYSRGSKKPGPIENKQELRKLLIYLAIL